MLTLSIPVPPCPPPPPLLPLLQVRALQQIIGTLHQCKNFDTENYDTLSRNTTKYAAKLLKKQDQCTLVSQCAHLFWTGRGADGSDPRCAETDMVLQCLKRALRTNESVLDSVAQSHHYVDILNEYLYFYGQECPKIETKYITGLVQLCMQNIKELDAGKEGVDVVRAHMTNTVKFIKSRAREDERYAAIELP